MARYFHDLTATARFNLTIVVCEAVQSYRGGCLAGRPTRRYLHRSGRARDSKGSVVSILRVQARRGGDAEKTGGVSS